MRVRNANAYDSGFCNLWISYFQLTSFLSGGKPNIVIPDYKIYTVGEHTPELLKLQQDLAAKGLKDPWLRNEVWRYDMTNRMHFTPNQQGFHLVFRGFIPGLVLATVSTLIWWQYDKIHAAQKYYKSESHGHHDDHH